jgi:diguanylate cyclase (GGDEF)-like protein/hemerythrin-like metal-binding protein
MYTHADRIWIDRIAEEALQRIRALGTPLDPRSFELWFAYFSGYNKELTQAVNDLFAESPVPSSRQMAQLYERLVSSCRAAERINLIGGLVKEQSTAVADVIGEASQATQGYGERLSNVAPRLAMERLDGGLRSVVDELLSSTEEIQRNNALLVNRLQSAAEHVRGLQGQLEKIQIENMIDPLTGVGNRRFFEKSLLRLLGEAKTDVPVSLLLVDVDNFKQFNDRHGHVVGDDVLRLVASSIRQKSRQEDIICRYGGDEFAIILPRTPLKGALLFGDKIKAAITARELHRRSTSESLGRLTISIGAAEYRLGEAADALVERADHWMYAAKQAGRTRKGHKVSDSADDRIDRSKHELLWYSSYACGEEKIDRQHRELFDLANILLFDHVGSFEINQLTAIIEVFIIHLQDHFHYEEAVLAVNHYDALDDHKSEHQRLLEDARRMKDAAASAETSLADLREYLVNSVVVGHMLEHDRRFFPLFKGPEASEAMAQPLHSETRATADGSADIPEIGSEDRK